MPSASLSCDVDSIPNNNTALFHLILIRSNQSTMDTKIKLVILCTHIVEILDDHANWCWCNSWLMDPIEG